MYTFKAPLSHFESPLWGHHIMVDPEIARKLLEAGHSRVVATLDDTHTYHCALMSDGNGGRYLLVNKGIRKKLDLHIGQLVAVLLWPDKSPYGMAMPEELGELLQQDTLFNTYFHALTPGKQRNLIHVVSKYKRPETRLHKAITIMEYLLATRGRLDFKELYEAFKRPS